MFNVRKHPHISACLFMYLHLHCWNNIYAGKTNIHNCYVNSPQDWYGSSYCCSALRDVENREKRKHVNLLFHADGDEKDRRGRERFWDRERQTERLISLSRSPSCTHLELCVCVMSWTNVVSFLTCQHVIIELFRHVEPSDHLSHVLYAPW